MSNYWLVGHAAAMRAVAPICFDEALADAGELKSHQRDLFMRGWRSAWGCERRDEAESLNVAEIARRAVVRP